MEEGQNDPATSTGAIKHPEKRPPKARTEHQKVSELPDPPIYLVHPKTRCKYQRLQLLGTVLCIHFVIFPSVSTNGLIYGTIQRFLTNRVGLRDVTKSKMVMVTESQSK
jgi:hypothetical protein